MVCERSMIVCICVYRENCAVLLCSVFYFAYKPSQHTNVAVGVAVAAKFFASNFNLATEPTPLL